MSKMRRRFTRFSVRTLFVASALMALALGWWFCPYVAETRREDGSLRTKFELRRDWRGHIVGHGTQRWYCQDGSVITKTIFGAQLQDDFFGTRHRDFDELMWLIDDTVDPDDWEGELELTID